MITENLYLAWWFDAPVYSLSNVVTEFLWYAWCSKPHKITVKITDMPLFEIKNKKAKQINTKEFMNELELHQLIDMNLEEIFGVRFIKDEYITDKHGRIETLGLDESNRPIIIEYKKTKERGQLVQANRYMTCIKTTILHLTIGFFYYLCG